MDLGIDRLIEMIEERFGVVGKPITTAMLIMVVLAVFVMAAEIVWKKAALPLSKLVLGFGWRATQEEVVADLLSLGLFVLLAYVGFRVGNHFFTKKVDKVKEGVQKTLEETRNLHNETKETIAAIDTKRNEALVVLGRADKVLEQSMTVLKEAEQKRIEAGGEPIIPPIFDKEDSQSQ